MLDINNHGRLDFNNVVILMVHMWLDLRKPSLSAQEMKYNLLLIIKLTPLHYIEIPST